jgi:putative membrane protein
MLRKMQWAAVLVLFTGLVAARADQKNPPAGSDQPFNDAAFVAMAASDGMHEVVLGKIAQQKAKNDAVKQYGEMLVKDHTKANEQLKAAAKAANIPVPEKMNAHHQKEVERFQNYKGENFDQDFAKHEVADHVNAIALFTRASKEAKNPQIKNFATQTLPALKKHLEAAKKLEK